MLEMNVRARFTLGELRLPYESQVYLTSATSTLENKNKNKNKSKQMENLSSEKNQTQQPGVSASDRWFKCWLNAQDPASNVLIVKHWTFKFWPMNIQMLNLEHIHAERWTLKRPTLNIYILAQSFKMLAEHLNVGQT